LLQAACASAGLDSSAGQSAHATNASLRLFNRRVCWRFRPTDFPYAAGLRWFAYRASVQGGNMADDEAASKAAHMHTIYISPRTCTHARTHARTVKHQLDGVLQRVVEEDQSRLVQEQARVLPPWQCTLRRPCSHNRRGRQLVSCAHRSPTPAAAEASDAQQHHVFGLGQLRLSDCLRFPGSRA